MTRLAEGRRAVDSAPRAAALPISRGIRTVEGRDGLWVLRADAATTATDDRDALAAALSAQRPAGSLLLVTCHRVELYGAAIDDGAPDRPAGPAAIDGPAARPLPALDLPSLRLDRDDAAIDHLLRLAAGLESAVLGEDQVLSQLRTALTEARAAGPLDPLVDRLAQTALGVGRRVRREERPAERSLAVRALRWLERLIGPLDGKTLLVVGTGPMGRDVVRSASRRGARLSVASRDRAMAERVAAGSAGEALDLSEAAQRASQVDGIVVALAGPWTALGMAGPALPPIVDLSAPSAIPAAVRAGLGGRLIRIDGLFSGPGTPIGPRSDLEARFVERAEREVLAAGRAFRRWRAARAAVPTMRLLRIQAEARRAIRVERLLRRLPDLAPHDRELVRQCTEQLVADLLHEPLTRLREDVDGRSGAAARHLFDL